MPMPDTTTNRQQQRRRRRYGPSDGYHHQHPAASPFHHAPLPPPVPFPGMERGGGAGGWICGRMYMGRRVPIDSFDPSNDRRPPKSTQSIDTRRPTGSPAPFFHSSGLRSRSHHPPPALPPFASSTLEPPHGWGTGGGGGGGRYARLYPPPLPAEGTCVRFVFGRFGVGVGVSPSSWGVGLDCVYDGLIHRYLHIHIQS